MRMQEQLDSFQQMILPFVNWMPNKKLCARILSLRKSAKLKKRKRIEIPTFPIGNWVYVFFPENNSDKVLAWPWTSHVCPDLTHLKFPGAYYSLVSGTNDSEITDAELASELRCPGCKESTCKSNGFMWGFFWWDKPAGIPTHWCNYNKQTSVLCRICVAFMLFILHGSDQEENTQSGDRKLLFQQQRACFQPTINGTLLDGTLCFVPTSLCGNVGTEQHHTTEKERETDGFF